MDLGMAALLLGMVALGFRHGFDWDHIAAITDITSTTTAGHTEVDVPVIAPVTPHGHDANEMRGHQHHHDTGPGAMHAFRESRWAHEQRHAIGLASLYALGHATVVTVLGIAALLLGAVLPDWIDPILEKVVGVTLLLLGAWVLFSVVQYLRGKGEFRMRSRWMLVFDVVRHGWGALQARIHGVGAETGSQALLLAGIAGVTGATGVVILFAFVVGLLLSNSLIAIVTASGFIGAQRMQTIYVIVGAFAGVASLLVGALFVLGMGTALPDLQQLLFGGDRG